MRKYTVTIEDDAGGLPPTFLEVTNLDQFREASALMRAAMPDFDAANKLAEMVFEAQAFDAKPEEHLAVREVLQSELKEGLSTFNEKDFMLLVDSPDVVPGEFAKIVMLHFRDYMGRSYVLPLGDRMEAMRIGAGIMEIAKRLGQTVPRVEAVHDVFLFHGQQTTNPVVGRIESIVQVLVASGETISLRFSELSLVEFRELIDDMIKSAAQQRAEMMQ